MKIVEITVGYTQKVNTGNYQSKDYFVSMKAEIEYDEDPQTSSAILFDRCKVAVDRAIVEDE